MMLNMKKFFLAITILAFLNLGGCTLLDIESTSTKTETTTKSEEKTIKDLEKKITELEQRIKELEGK